MPPKGDDDTASTSGETANTASTAGVPPKGGGGRAKKGGGRRKKIDDATGTKLQKKLKAATMGTSISKLLKRYDKSGDGLLDAKELTQLIRRDLKVPEREVSDADIGLLIAALDDDGGGTLSIDELADFVERGTATFFSGPPEGGAAAPADAAAPAAADKPAAAGGAAAKPAAKPAAAGGGGGAKKKKKPKQMDDAVADKLQARLKAATIGTDPQKLFRKYDKDKGGTLDEKELTTLIRKDLKLGPGDVSDKDIKLLVAALDDDGGGALSIDELADFVERGKASFFAENVEGGNVGPKWGEKVEESAALKAAKAKTAAKSKKPMSKDTVDKLQNRLQAATYGTPPAELFASFDKSGDGSLDAAELKGLIRKELKIPPSDLTDSDIATLVKWLDDDDSGSVSIDELADFVARGAATFGAGPDPNAPAGLGWGERLEDSPELAAAKAKTAAKKGKKNRAGRIDAAVASKIQKRLKASLVQFGDEDGRRAFFARFDKSGDGSLDGPELKALVRKELKISAGELSDADIGALVKALDDDGSGSLSIDELLDFVENGDLGGGAPGGAGAAPAKAPAPPPKPKPKPIRMADTLFKEADAAPGRDFGTAYERGRAARRSAPVAIYRDALRAVERQPLAGLATATTLVSLARAQQLQADGEAPALARIAKTYEQACRIFEQELGKAHATVANTLDAMVAVLEAAGDAKGAVKARERAAKVRKELAFQAEKRKREREEAANRAAQSEALPPI
jgi:Ca2+-binding EF-hand superfamily protein